MITQCAQVVAMHGDTMRLRVKSLRNCSRCAQGQGCGGGVFNRLLPTRDIEFEVRRNNEYRAGDELNIGINEHNVLLASVMVYLWPLVTMIAMALLAQRVFASDLATVLFALMGLSFSLLTTRLFQKRWINRWQPVVLAKLSASNEC